MADEAVRRLPESTPILVTGGSGFIGTNVVQHLLDLGFDNVRTLDLETPRHPGHGELWTSGDIRRSDDVTRAVKEHAPQVIVHLAAH